MTLCIGYCWRWSYLWFWLWYRRRRNCICRHLCCGNLWFDNETVRVQRYLHRFACFEAEVAALFGIPTIRVGEGFSLPQWRLNAIAYSGKQYIGIFEARQVNISSKVVGQLFDADMIAAPQRDTI